MSDQIRQHIENLEERPVLWLDLDGTIRKPKSGKQFSESKTDYILFDGVESRIWEYRSNGFIIVGITNQGGVAHGFKSVSEVEFENEFLRKLFVKDPFHIIKACLHEPSGKIFPFNRKSLFRKPNIGMLALVEYELFNQGYLIDWKKSLFVGDRQEDQDCAKNAEIHFVWANLWRGEGS